MRDWTSGYTRAELERAEQRFGLRFPPDLAALLLERRPAGGYDWRSDDDPIRQALQWPLEGLLFDVEQDVLWWPEWGDRPATPGERAEVVTAIVEAAPRLIPIFHHRYIPESPHEAGNPIFSVMQSDIIYYGADLADYLRREFSPHPPRTPVGRPGRHIPFWSDLVERWR
ncbi:MAG: SMI1/KNR4 family protein [Allosphingosinicella sp.]